jgi:hypothetical protein
MRTTQYPGVDCHFLQNEARARVWPARSLRALPDEQYQSLSGTLVPAALIALVERLDWKSTGRNEEPRPVCRFWSGFTEGGRRALATTRHHSPGNRRAI